MILDELLRAEHHAAQAAALAVDVLGGGIDDAVGAELERLLIERCRKYIVDDEGGARRVGDVGDRLDIEHVQRRIGRSLQKERLRVRPHRLAPLLEVGAVD